MCTTTQAPATTSAPSLRLAAAEGAPITCTADLQDQRGVRAQIDAYRAAFSRLLDAQRFPGGFRWTFAAEPGPDSQLGALGELGQLAQLAEREHTCCRFFTFELTRAGDRIIWETRAGHEAAAVLEEYFSLPQRLAAEPRPGHDLVLLKSAAAGAGLTLSSDAAKTG